MKTLLIISLLFMTGCSCEASFGAVTPTGKEHKIDDVVMTIKDIPYNECRVVINPPYAVNHMTLPVPMRMCNTFGVVGLQSVDFKR